jgi:hypothetical protein
MHFPPAAVSGQKSRKLSGMTPRSKKKKKMKKEEKLLGFQEAVTRRGTTAKQNTTA